MEQFIDKFGRKITYLRVAITDRCNFRCVYCMPPEGIVRRPHEEIMTFEEIAAVVRVAAEHGIHKIRLTGGEPLVRKGLPDLVRMIAETPGIDDISLTTNGLLLEKMIVPLHEAGLKRINVSLDTLQPEKFRRVTRGGSFESVWRGLLLAESLGLWPIKINVVSMRGVNDDELQDLAMLSVTRGWHVRFIELMPVNNQQSWGEGFPAPADTFLPIAEIKKALEPLGLVKVETSSNDGPAQEFRMADGQGRIGFISPLSDHFCNTCNRLRMTADGVFRPCLLQDIEVPFLKDLRAGKPILEQMVEAIDAKPSGHELTLNHLPSRRCMIQIGG